MDKDNGLVMETKDEAAPQVTDRGDRETVSVQEDSIKTIAQTTTTIPGAKDLTLKEAIVAWPYAAMWSTIFMMPVILVAYSPAWIAVLYAMPAFARRFGFKFGDMYIIPAQWQSALSACAMIGQIVGAPVSAVIMDKLGRRITFLATLALTAGFVFIQFFAVSLGMTLAGGLLVGITMGSYGVLSLTYSIEIAPFRLRGVIGGMFSLSIVVGTLITALVSSRTVSIENEWSYKVGYALQWGWPAILMPLIYFAPESPVWLIRQGRRFDAERSLRTLAAVDFDVDPTLSLIEETDRREREMDDATSYVELFQGTNLRRTAVAVTCYVSMIATGTVLINQLAYFMQLAGIEAELAFNINLGSFGAAVIGSFVGMGLLAKFNRRKIYIAGQALSTLILVIIGITQAAPHYFSRPSIVRGQAALFVIWNCLYGAILSPFSTTIMGEISSTRLRSKTIAVANIAQFSGVIIATVVNPYLINPDEAALQGYIGFIAGASNLVFLVLIYFYVPETSRPSDELDALFEHNISARHFATYDLSRLTAPESRISITVAD
ncbi:hypothetical protein AYO20_10331 [Fonsecaea nubica]|uniref:Major facilitator superfamily (MFS) profile domain-containing protein n=1 Tax=Fonsecaea nubica TaxID=856822 RepID=A0A178C7E0_9EURO|nr:hypothetical protein AYO20_10331 [Fonsecaea nubica]OAL25869.1 hypothetical protein AYO20_10331 [Fonsecaea nubica]